MRGVIVLPLLCLAISAAAPASAENFSFAGQSKLRLSNYMQIYGNAQAPTGYLRFCEQNPLNCQTKGSENRLEVSPEGLEELDAVNRYVNSSIAPATDVDLYGVREYWALPYRRGDCEDYALLKQKLLIEKGWPTSALLLTVVRDTAGEGHAILTVRTDKGDYVLDNKVDEIRIWNTTNYKYIMRQSYLNPKVWISLDPGEANPPVSLAGVQPGE